MTQENTVPQKETAQQTDRLTEIQIDRLTNIPTEKGRHILLERSTDGQTDKPTEMKDIQQGRLINGPTVNRRQSNKNER